MNYPDTAWRIAMTEPRQERIAAAYLIGRRFQVYLPTILKEVRRFRAGSHKVERPMFPSYLFVRFSLQMPHWERLFTTPGIRPGRSLLKANNHYAELPDEAVDAIKETENRLRGELVAGAFFKVGDPVKVRINHFTELFAKVESLHDDERVVLLLSLLGRESRVMASADQLVRLSQETESKGRG
jgi:transcriptional antiterminator RfaH